MDKPWNQGRRSWRERFQTFDAVELYIFLWYLSAVLILITLAGGILWVFERVPVLCRMLDRVIARLRGESP